MEWEHRAYSASTKEIFDVIDTTRSSFYFSAHSMLLFCYRAAAAFVVSDFRGPRPMSMRIHQRGSAIETKVLAN